MEDRTVVAGKVLPLEVENRILKLLCTYLLYDRSQETALRLAFIGLVSERHAKFHNAEVTYDECRNMICINAKLIINAAQAPEVLLNAFAIELMKTFAINYTPDGERAIHAKLVRKDQIVQPPSPPNGGLIVTP